MQLHEGEPLAIVAREAVQELLVVALAVLAGPAHRPVVGEVVPARGEALHPEVAGGLHPQGVRQPQEVVVGEAGGDGMAVRSLRVPGQEVQSQGQRLARGLAVPLRQRRLRRRERVLPDVEPGLDRDAALVHGACPALEGLAEHGQPVRGIPYRPLLDVALRRRQFLPDVLGVQERAAARVPRRLEPPVPVRLLQESPPRPPPGDQRVGHRPVRPPVQGRRLLGPLRQLHDAGDQRLDLLGRGAAGLHRQDARVQLRQSAHQGTGDGVLDEERKRPVVEQRPGLARARAPQGGLVGVREALRGVAACRGAPGAGHEDEGREHRRGASHRATFPTHGRDVARAGPRPQGVATPPDRGAFGARRGRGRPARAGGRAPRAPGDQGG